MVVGGLLLDASRVDCAIERGKGELGKGGGINGVEAVSPDKVTGGSV